MPTPSAWIRSTLSNTRTGKPARCRLSAVGQPTDPTAGDDDVVHMSQPTSASISDLTAMIASRCWACEQARLSEPVEADAASR